MGELRVRSEYRLTVFPDQPVAGQSAELGMLQHDFTLSVPLRQSATDEWSASVRIRDQEFDTGAILPDTGEPFPDNLWNVASERPTGIASNRAGSGPSTSTSGRPATSPSRAWTSWR